MFGRGCFGAMVEELVPDSGADGAAEGWIVHELLVAKEIVPLVVVEEGDDAVEAAVRLLIIMRHYCYFFKGHTENTENTESGKYR